MSSAGGRLTPVGKPLGTWQPPDYLGPQLVFEGVVLLRIEGLDCWGGRRVQRGGGVSRRLWAGDAIAALPRRSIVGVAFGFAWRLRVSLAVQATGWEAPAAEPHKH